MTSQFPRCVSQAIVLSALVLGWQHEPVVHAQSDLEAKTSVAVLIDVSKSFAPLVRTDQAALDQLERAIERAATASWEPPISIYWATVGNSGVTANSSVCGSALFHPRMVRRPGSDEFSSVAQLQAWLRECARAVVTRSQQHPEAYTDISGAVAIAAENGRRVNGRKIIAILSDFAEDRPAGTKPTDFEMSGETVVLLYRGNATDAIDGNLLLNRVKQWEQRFKTAGAKSACRVSVLGIDATKIASCF
jgi:hypothetical protein